LRVVFSAFSYNYFVIHYDNKKRLNAKALKRLFYFKYLCSTISHVKVGEPFYQAVYQGTHRKLS
jgi:hypothetical protein